MDRAVTQEDAARSGVQEPRGWADRFACPQKPSGLLETPAWPHGWTVG